MFGIFGNVKGKILSVLTVCALLNNLFNCQSVI